MKRTTQHLPLTSYRVAILFCFSKQVALLPDVKQVVAQWLALDIANDVALVSRGLLYAPSVTLHVILTMEKSVDWHVGVKPKSVTIWNSGSFDVLINTIINHVQCSHEEALQRLLFAKMTPKSAIHYDIPTSMNSFGYRSNPSGIYQWETVYYSI